jgi:hypothetical protein
MLFFLFWISNEQEKKQENIFHLYNKPVFKQIYMKLSRIEHPRHDWYAALNDKKHDSQNISQIKQHGVQVKVVRV